MNSPKDRAADHNPDDVRSIARRLAGLQELGFQRVDVSAPVMESTPLDGRTWKTIASRPAMSTLVTVTVISRSPTRAEEAAGRAFEEMDVLIGILSRFDPASPLTYLNQQGRISGAPPELARVVRQGLRFHQLSSGSFDPTVRPLVDLFQAHLAGENAGDPDEKDVGEALAMVDAAAVRVTGLRIAYARSGMSMTLDGIAKGYIVDQMAGVLRGKRLRNFLIDAGGDIRTSGFREDGRPWQVAIQDPSRSDDFPAVLSLSGAAVATSGSYRGDVDTPRAYHHIVDSEEGRCPDRYWSVSVVAPTSAQADALATTCYILDPLRALELVERTRGAACLIQARDGALLPSARWDRVAAPR